MSIELVRVDEDAEKAWSQSPLQVALHNPQWATQYIQHRYGAISVNQARYSYGLPNIRTVNSPFLPATITPCSFKFDEQKPGFVKRTWRDIVEGLKFWWSEIW